MNARGIIELHLSEPEKVVSREKKKSFYGNYIYDIIY